MGGTRLRLLTLTPKTADSPEHLGPLVRIDLVDLRQGHGTLHYRDLDVPDEGGFCRCKLWTREEELGLATSESRIGIYASVSVGNISTGR